jgi:hypothetical protein
MTLAAVPAAAAFKDACRTASALLARDPRPTASELGGLHNPWRYGAREREAWSLLALCEDARIVAALGTVLGPDIVLWESEFYASGRDYRRFVETGLEGRYWPVVPLVGAVVLFALSVAPGAVIATLEEAKAASAAIDQQAPVFVARYMPATSFYDRDPRAPANLRCMEERLLTNYAERPLWLVAGRDRAGSDFVRGFAPPVPRQTGRTTDPLIPPRRA